MKQITLNVLNDKNDVLNWYHQQQSDNPIMVKLWEQNDFDKYAYDRKTKKREEKNKQDLSQAEQEKIIDIAKETITDELINIFS